MIESSDENIVINENGLKKTIKKSVASEVVRVIAFFIIGFIGLKISTPLFQEINWQAGAISAAVFIGLGFLANFLIKKLFAQTFNLDFAGVKKIEYTGVLKKKWSVTEHSNVGDGLRIGDAYYILLNDKTFKVGSSFNNTRSKLYDTLIMDKTYKIVVSEQIPDIIFSMDEVK
ncbi:MAG TPA: hypothetical protein VGF30_08735 [Bacteroidia bacterium]